MSFVASAITAAISIGGGIIQSNDQKAAARKAARAQSEGVEQGVLEQQRQFDEIQKLLQPYVAAGDTALTQQMSLLGLGGQEAQQTAIQQIEESPRFKALSRQGESALLQNASATGGLRGGDIQGALTQYRPNLLASEIENQYAKLQALSGRGQSAATGQSGFGQTTGANISNLYGKQGNIGANLALAQGSAGVGQTQSILKGLGPLINIPGTGAPQNQSMTGIDAPVSLFT